MEQDGTTFEYQGEALLNATGRAPNVHDVGLEHVSKYCDVCDSAWHA